MPSLPAADKLHNTCVRTQFEALIAKSTELSIETPAHQQNSMAGRTAANTLGRCSKSFAVILQMSIAGRCCQAHMGCRTQHGCCSVMRMVAGWLKAAACVHPIPPAEYPDDASSYLYNNADCAQHSNPQVTHAHCPVQTCRWDHKRSMAASSTRLLAPRPGTVSHFHPGLLLDRDMT